MRKSLAPSQKLPNIAAKKPKLSSKDCTEDKENSGKINHEKSLLDTLKAIRKSNSIDEADVREDNTNFGFSLESEFSFKSREHKEVQCTSACITSLRQTTNPPKFCPPTRFMPPLLSSMTSKANNDQPDHSTDTAHYYSVIW